MKAIRILLLPVSLFTWLAVVVRNWFFDIGILNVTRVDVPVVSVGNLSAGGTGKTPLVEVIVGKLAAQGHKPAVLSRGYRRKTRGYVKVAGVGQQTVSTEIGGDEPVLLSERLPGTTIAVDEDRVDGARRILTETDSDCIVLDDGFQHRYLDRTINCLLLTAREILEGDWILPAGNRREGLGSVRRADIVVITKCADYRNFEDARSKLERTVHKPTVGIRTVPHALRNVRDGRRLERAPASEPVLVFSGIGDPAAFEQSVREFGCTIGARIDFGDHHWYSDKDFVTIKGAMSANRTVLAVTTTKDWVRLKSMGGKAEEFLLAVPLYVLDVAVEFVHGENILDGMLRKLDA